MGCHAEASDEERVEMEKSMDMQPRTTYTACQNFTFCEQSHKGWEIGFGVTGASIDRSHARIYGAATSYCKGQVEVLLTWPWGVCLYDDRMV